jgi:hypothetical protein
MIYELNTVAAKAALQKQIEEQIQKYLSKGGKIKEFPTLQVGDVKEEVLRSLEKGKHFVSPDYKDNCE